MRLARLYSASSRLARRSPPPEHEFFFFSFLSCNDVSYECENSFSPRRSPLPPPLLASPRYLYCPFSFHAISPGNLSARFLARPSFTAAVRISWIFHRFSCPPPPLHPTHFPLFLFFESISTVAKESTRIRVPLEIFKAERGGFFVQRGILSSYNFDLNVRNT